MGLAVQRAPQEEEEAPNSIKIHEIFCHLCWWWADREEEEEGGVGRGGVGG